MYGILASALAGLAGFLVRKVVFTLLIGTVLYWVVSGFVPILVAQLFPNSAGAAAGLRGAFSGIPEGVWYFMDIFAISTGFPLVLSAWVARFIVRRIPFIG